MRQISGELIEVECTEGTITFTQGNVCGVFVSKRLFEAAENAAAVSRLSFVDHGGSCFPRVFLSAVARSVAYHNHASDQGMTLKILTRFENRFFVVICGERRCQAIEREILFLWAAWGPPLERKQDEEVKSDENCAESGRDSAVPKQELDGVNQ